MRTRRGFCYLQESVSFSTDKPREVDRKRRRDDEITETEHGGSFCKRTKVYEINETEHGGSFCDRTKMSPSADKEGGGEGTLFEALPDDLVVFILCKLSSSASCPADFINILITCKRFNGLGLSSMVMSKASPRTFAIKAMNWSDSTHRFLKRFAEAGNVDACYVLGMIRFYCLGYRGSGASLMAKAAINSHAQALYSLAVIQFNGSGGSKNDKDLRAAVALCSRAAFLGHVDALRELGHCLQDGYGVRQNVIEGRRFLVQANAQELAAVLSYSPAALTGRARPCIGWNNQVTSVHHTHGSTPDSACPLLSDFGCNLPAAEAHPANQFVAEWFTGRVGKLGLGLRMCSHAGCGRPETRLHEFRRCSVCGTVNYCSRACQALDWKLRHKVECVPMERWFDGDGEAGGGVGGGDGAIGVVANGVGDS
ncbi:hypothetical protein Dimus_031745 [Dionaea muscipula]